MERKDFKMLAIDILVEISEYLYSIQENNKELSKEEFYILVAIVSLFKYFVENCMKGD